MIHVYCPPLSTTGTTAIILGIILTLTRCLHGAQFYCPPAGASAVCTCKMGSKTTPSGDTTLSISCSDLSLQSQLDEYMGKIQAANPGLRGTIPAEEFSISTSSLSSLDLTQIFNEMQRIEKFSFTKSPNLKAILQSTPWANIIGELLVSNTGLSNQEVGNLLLYLTNGPKKAIVSYCPSVKSVAPGFPLIPHLDSPRGLSDLVLENNEIDEIDRGAFPKDKYLESISLQSNKIKRVGQGAFANIKNLETVILSRNKINKVEKGAFFFTYSVKNCSVDLSRNELTADNGLEAQFIQTEDAKDNKSKLKCEVNLENNKLEYLSQLIFQELLNSKGPIQKLLLKGNPFVCDKRMRWLRNFPVPKNVEGVDCTNDPGKTVFNSDKTNIIESGAALPASSVLIIVILLNILHFLNINQ